MHVCLYRELLFLLCSNEPNYSQPAVDLMRQIRKAIDPKGILNPDKVVEMPTKEATRAKL